MQRGQAALPARCPFGDEANRPGRVGHPGWRTVRDRRSPLTISFVLGETITHLEMTSPEQLVSGRPSPARIVMQEIGRQAAAVVHSTYARIGAPHGWTGRSAWSDACWEQELSRPGVRAWTASVDAEIVGFVELEAQSNGDVGIVVFGLVPEFVGRGFGGAFLTLVTQLAWELRSPGGAATTRVYVETSSRDHPNAIPNYERRGFRTFRTERAGR